MWGWNKVRKGRASSLVLYTCTYLRAFRCNFAWNPTPTTTSLFLWSQRTQFDDKLLDLGNLVFEQPKCQQERSVLREGEEKDFWKSSSFPSPQKRRVAPRSQLQHKMGQTLGSPCTINGTRKKTNRCARELVHAICIIKQPPSFVHSLAAHAHSVAVVGPLFFLAARNKKTAELQKKSFLCVAHVCTCMSVGKRGRRKVSCPWKRTGDRRQRRRFPYFVLRGRRSEVRTQ